MIRVCIEYHDAAPTAETWPDVYADRERALKFLATMAEIHSGVISAIWCEVWCPEHEEWEDEDAGVCVGCSFQCCRDVLEDHDGDLLCETCAEDRNDDAAAFADPHWRGVSTHGPL